MSLPTVRWTRIEPLTDSGIPSDSRFSAMDSLRDAWKAQLDVLTPEEFKARRRRTLRRQAVDTGVIAQVYEVDRDSNLPAKWALVSRTCTRF